MSFIDFVKRKLDEFDKKQQEKIVLQQKIAEAVAPIKEEEAIKTAVFKEKAKGEAARQATIKNPGTGLSGALNNLNKDWDFKKGMNGLMGEPSKEKIKPPKIIF